MNLHEQFSQWRLARIESGELGKSAGRDPSWELFKEYKKGEKFETWMKDINCTWVKEFFSADSRECTEEEMLKQNVKYRMAQQKYQDTNRIERATFRADARLHNAIEEYSSAIALSPESFVLAYRSRSSAYCAKGDYESAVKDLKKCLSINPKLGYIYISLFAPLSRMQQFEEARKYYQLSMGNDVNTYTKDENWKYYQYYVQAAAENIPNGDYEIALQQVEKALTEHGTAVTEISKTDYVNMLSLKGFLLEKLNKKEEAKQIYNQSLAINSIQPEVSKSLLALGNGAAKDNGKSTVVVPKVVVPTSTDKTAPSIVITSPQVTRGLKVVQKNKSTTIT